MIELLEGDCRVVMEGLEAGSFATCITDPPYELGFMGKSWDRSGVAFDVDVWRWVLRLLKPGGMLLAFGGTRTFHRMTCAIEDAGFEIRDTMCWLYGSGFPKSMDISKAIDKAAGAERDDAGANPNARPNSGRTGGIMGEACGRVFNERLTAPATDLARLWNGYGTALKPAWEPIVLAMKPIEGTFAANALAHGVAGLNVDGGRIGADGGTAKGTFPKGDSNGIYGDGINGACRIDDIGKGRFPANVLLDEEAAAMLDAQAGERSSGSRQEGTEGSSGGPSRFFKVVGGDKPCSLCALPWSPRQGRLSAWKNTPAGPVENRGATTQATPGNTAPPSALPPHVVSLALNAKSVGSLCDSCAICIAQSLVAMRQDRDPEPHRGWGSIGEPRRRILTRCLASFVAHLGNTDTTPTTDSLRLFFGFVRDAMRSSTPTGATARECAQESRLFYTGKASSAERSRGNRHPTVKPVDLMIYLATLTKPPVGDGKILDPFMGSGTTALAAVATGRAFTGIDIDPENVATARARLEGHRDGKSISKKDDREQFILWGEE